MLQPTVTSGDTLARGAIPCAARVVPLLARPRRSARFENRLVSTGSSAQGQRRDDHSAHIVFSDSIGLFSTLMPCLRLYLVRTAGDARLSRH